MDKFYIEIAGLLAEMNARSGFSRNFCSDFIVDVPDRNPDIVAATERADVLKELAAGDPGATEDYAEVLCLYRKIAEQLPNFNRFVFHGAAISYKDETGYLFTAPSGTGKSTHIKLWRQYIGKDINIINGDKPILHITENGVIVCSTPWAGKENWKRNISLPLKSICIINRGSDNTVQKLSPKDAVNAVMHQVYLPKNSIGLGLTLDLMDKLLNNIPIYLLSCDISENAVDASFSALTGIDYKTIK